MTPEESRKVVKLLSKLIDEKIEDAIALNELDSDDTYMRADIERIEKYLEKALSLEWVIGQGDE